MCDLRSFIAYQGCSKFFLNGKEKMMVWGGLHENDVTGSLEYLDLESMHWAEGDIS